MQEGTGHGRRRPLSVGRPFFVMATQNPIEQEGTYPLPEAQLDRFLFKLVVGYSGREELATIIDRTTKRRDDQARQSHGRHRDQAVAALVRDVILAPHVQDYIVRLMLATHPNGPFAAHHQPISSLGLQPAQRPDAGAGRQSRRSFGRPLQRQLRRRPPRLSAGDWPPRHSEL